MTAIRGNPRESAQRFAVTHEGVRRARQWLQQELDHLALDQKRISGACVSISELGANLVDHASPRPAEFRLAVRRVANGVKIELSARTRSFSAPRQFRQLLMADHMDILSTRGRGMSMVGHYFPDAVYRPPSSANPLERFTLRLAVS